MFKVLYPDLFITSLAHIPLQELKSTGKRGFILDLDNTVTEWNSNNITAEVAQWFTQIRAEGFKACIISNNGAKRVEQVANVLGIPFISRAIKPRRGAFLQAVALLGIEPEEAVVIGDQIFTDIMGGNRAGLYTILVEPIASREFFGTKLSRIMEYFVMKQIKKQLD